MTISWKSIQFLLSSNLSEVVTLFVATVMNFRLFCPSISSDQLSYRLLTAIALGMEEEKRILCKAASIRVPIFAGGFGASVIYQGLFDCRLDPYFLLYWFIQVPDYRERPGHRHDHGLSPCPCVRFSISELAFPVQPFLPLSSRTNICSSAMAVAFILTIGVIYLPGR